MKIFTKGLQEKSLRLFGKDRGPKDILHFKYKIAMQYNVLLSATPINADDAN